MAQLPTVQQLYKVKLLKRTFQEAWNGSFPNSKTCREVGGYIYADPDSIDPRNPSRLKVIVEPMTLVRGDSMNQKNPTQNAAIDLNGPGTGQAGNWILVANFHTHPLHGNAKPIGGDNLPSRADERNAFRRGTPGIVISRGGIYAYGPERRTDRHNPKTYPPDVQGDPPMRVDYPRVGGRPNNAKYEWDGKVKAGGKAKGNVNSLSNLYCALGDASSGHHDDAAMDAIAGYVSERDSVEYMSDVSEVEEGPGEAEVEEEAANK